MPKKPSDSATPSSNVRYIDPEGATPAQGLYSHASRVTAGDLYFIAGQLAVDDEGRVVGKHDFERQFHKVFENLGTVLEGLGVTFNEVAKFTTYFVHSQDIEKFMKLRADLFPEDLQGRQVPAEHDLRDRSPGEGGFPARDRGDRAGAVARSRSRSGRRGAFREARNPS